MSSSLSDYFESKVQATYLTVGGSCKKYICITTTRATNRGNVRFAMMKKVIIRTKMRVLSSILVE